VEFNEGPGMAGPGGSGLAGSGPADRDTTFRVAPLSGFTARRRGTLMVLAGLVGMGIGLPARADPLLTFPLEIRGHTLRVEVASTESERRLGLMHRRSMREDHGMVFTYDKPGPQAMWMRNTLIPLSVAFVGADGRILNIEDMQPLTEDAHASKGNAAWSIEANLGWFRKRGIRPGDRVKGLAALPANQ
jgi:uncharacterized protein